MQLYVNKNSDWVILKDWAIRVGFVLLDKIDVDSILTFNELK